MLITVSSVKTTVLQTLAAVGVREEDAAIILDTILFANQRGVATHGIGRLPLYVKKIKSGHFDPACRVETVSDSMGTAVLDAHNGFGQVAAYKATKLAIAKAKEYGVAVVGVRNSNNFGAAGYFGDLAAREGMAAMIYANAAPAIAPTGGTKTIFGTNPICYAFPGGAGEDPILLDMATTVAARGKIRLAAKNGEKIPADWATGPDGAPTDDPNEALKGALLPIGGYKGYGLSMFVDLLAGMLTGSAYGGGVKNLSKMDADSRNGHLFVVIDTQRFLPPEALKAATEQFRSSVKACGPEGRIFLPGEIEYLCREKHQDAVEISEKQYQELAELTRALGVQAAPEPVEV